MHLKIWIFKISSFEICSIDITKNYFRLCNCNSEDGSQQINISVKYQHNDQSPNVRSEMPIIRLQYLQLDRLVPVDDITWQHERFNIHSVNVSAFRA